MAIFLSWKVNVGGKERALILYKLHPIIINTSIQTEK
jgi:hypothetical protein